MSSVIPPLDGRWRVIGYSSPEARDRSIAYMLLAGMIQAVIAQRVGLTQGRISQIKQRDVALTDARGRRERDMMALWMSGELSPAGIEGLNLPYPVNLRRPLASGPSRFRGRLARPHPPGQPCGVFACQTAPVARRSPPALPRPRQPDFKKDPTTERPELAPNLHRLLAEHERFRQSTHGRLLAPGELYALGVFDASASPYLGAIAYRQDLFEARGLGADTWEELLASLGALQSESPEARRLPPPGGRCCSGRRRGSAPASTSGSPPTTIPSGSSGGWGRSNGSLRTTCAGSIAWWQKG